jgi:secreted trypsin-like serine protease
MDLSGRFVLHSSSSVSSISFWAGTIYLDNGGSRHEVEQIIVHEGYDENDSWKNDIAVVKVRFQLRRPLPPTRSVSTVSIQSFV